jgi:hypothetical protein
LGLAGEDHEGLASHSSLLCNVVAAIQSVAIIVPAVVGAGVFPVFWKKFVGVLRLEGQGPRCLFFFFIFVVEASREKWQNAAVAHLDGDVRIICCGRVYMHPWPRPYDA